MITTLFVCLAIVILILLIVAGCYWISDGSFFGTWMAFYVFDAAADVLAAIVKAILQGRD